jgi:hypothetical protein
MDELMSASCAVPPMAWPQAVGLDQSRPVVRPDCSHTLLMSHTAQHTMLAICKLDGFHKY